MSSIPVQLPLFPVDGKVCRICGALQPVEAFNFHDKAAGRRRSTCQSCDRAKTAAWIAANPERAKAGNAAWRKANPEKRNAAAAVYARTHKAELKARAAAYYEANTERILSRNAAWHEANREQHAALVAAWDDAHPEKRRAICAAWGKANRGKVHAKARVRKQRIVINGGHYTGAEWEALKAQYDYRCLMCGLQEPEITLTFDHVIPVSKGGTDDVSNGQPLCRLCNAKKGAKTLDLR